MMVTEVNLSRVVARPGQLVAFATIVLDGEFAVHGVRLVVRPAGYLLDMPGNPAVARCRGCGARNRLDANYCIRCGVEGPRPAADPEPDHRYSSVCNPITREMRRKVEIAVIAAYEATRSVPAGGLAH